jgi:hypothetical protein
VATAELGSGGDVDGEEQSEDVPTGNRLDQMQVFGGGPEEYKRMADSETDCSRQQHLVAMELIAVFSCQDVHSCLKSEKDHDTGEDKFRPMGDFYRRAQGKDGQKQHDADHSDAQPIPG